MPCVFFKVCRWVLCFVAFARGYAPECESPSALCDQDDPKTRQTKGPVPRTSSIFAEHTEAIMRTPANIQPSFSPPVLRYRRMNLNKVCAGICGSRGMGFWPRNSNLHRGLALSRPSLTLVTWSPASAAGIYKQSDLVEERLTFKERVQTGPGR